MLKQRNKDRLFFFDVLKTINYFRPVLDPKLSALVQEQITLNGESVKTRYAMLS